MDPSTPEDYTNPTSTTNPSTIENEQQSSFFKNALASFIFIFLLYWILYLYINFQTRIEDGIGFSNFPLSPPGELHLGSIGMSGLHMVQSSDLIVCFFLTFLYYILYSFFRFKNKPVIVRLILISPFIFSIGYLLYELTPFSNTCRNEGDLCGLGIALFFFLFLGFSLFIYISSVITRLISVVITRHDSILIMLIFVLITSLALSIFIPMVFY